MELLFALGGLSEMTVLGVHDPHAVIGVRVRAAKITEEVESRRRSVVAQQ